MRKSADLPHSQPILFEPIFMERIWGGRRLETLYGKRLPPGRRIGESWEIVDRPEAQSVVQNGVWRGRTLHDLWLDHHKEIFGHVADSARFPLLIKLLDAQEKLSLQVHPPEKMAKELGGETKSEFWYIAHAEPSSEIYLGLKGGSSRADFAAAVAKGDADQHVQRLPVATGDAIFLPSGRVHAIGAGNVIVEIQQNSDTTYRVFDWNRLDANGAARQLHVDEALRSIDFDDLEPGLIAAEGEVLVRHSLFHVEKWTLSSERAAVPPGSFAIVSCLSGEVGCADTTIKPGEFFFVPANLNNRALRPMVRDTSLLRVTIPEA